MKSEIIKLYEDRDDVILTTYILDDSQEFLKGRKRPAILICPGGAYLNCSDREAEPIAMRFLAMGYDAFVLRYSVYSENGSIPFGYDAMPQPKEKTAYPKPMLEIGMALALIRNHADEWRVDSGRIALCGFSAGAHNAAMYASYWKAPIIRNVLPFSDEILKPDALILGYPLTDYVLMKETMADDPIQQGLFTFSNIAYLETAVPSDELLDEVSPARHVSEAIPPVFIWATANDELVPAAHSLVYAKALWDKKIPYELHMFERGPHGLSTADQASAEARSQLNADSAKWLPLVEAWLLKRFAYDLPERTDMEALGDSVRDETLG